VARSSALAGTSEWLRRHIEARLQRLWFAPSPSLIDRLLGTVLSPLSALAGAIARRRRARLLAADEPASVPVIVVGNLLVGGTGKTPIAIELARALTARGWHIGLLAVGYRGSSSGPMLVTADSDPRIVGDEPVLLAQATGLPVAAGRARRSALQALLTAHRTIDCVISDDGLQHEALPRTVELAVFDMRGLGNGRMLPAGPLREPAEAVATFDALLPNGTATSPLPHPRVQPVQIAPVGLRRLHDSKFESLATFRDRCANLRVMAVAGISQPQRFFALLTSLGITAQPLALPDHARLVPGWTRSVSADLIVMTDKDAVKSALPADPRCWSLVIEARLPAAFIDWLVERLHGQPTA
jgi:tetraacyldisaccharide 4'-kinase